MINKIDNGSGVLNFDDFQMVRQMIWININTITDGGSTATHSKAMSGWIGRMDWILLRKLVLLSPPRALCGAN